MGCCRYRVLGLSVSLLLAGVCVGQEVKSPDGRLVVTLSTLEGKVSYGVAFDGKVVLEPSPLGMVTSIGDFGSKLTADGVTTAVIDERYSLPHGKVKEVRYQANELTAKFSNGSGKETLEVIFRVSNNNVAFAQRISSKDKQRVTVLSENTGFKLPSTATAFVTPQVAWGGGFKGTKPSYEEGYSLDVPVGTVPRPKLGYTFPALFKVGENWALVSETGVSGRYAGTRLGNPTADGLYPIAFPEKEENAGLGEATVSGALPLQTPWRTITVGETLAPIVETTIATDVVKPLYEPGADYAAGRATWSWLLWQDGSMNVKDQTEFIDLAATMGYEYILMDANWDANPGREAIAKLVEYARSKKVGVFLWYNSNGYWNDAPQTPRNGMDTSVARHREMSWMKSIGVKGIKVDFFGGDKQMTMQLYESILTDANQYGLMCNFHGATLPRGWERMYPNHMTSEAALVSENLVFSQGFADNEARISTIYPLVRNPVAQLDYGGVIFNKRFSRNPERGSIRRTTDAFQLATAILYQSPIQHFALAPNNLGEVPEFVLEFMKKVPARWDETRLIDGYPGKFVVLARRSGERWYLAATHAEKSAKTVKVSAPWLKGKTMSLIADGEDKAPVKREVELDGEGGLELTIEPNGGAVLVSPE